MTRPEWNLAKKVIDFDYCPTWEEDQALAREVIRLRNLAYVHYDLKISYTGRELYDMLRSRIDKLYMALNARARGDEKDFDGDPAEPWNRLMALTAMATAGWLANARWAVLEHKRADEYIQLLKANNIPIPVNFYKKPEIPFTTQEQEASSIGPTKDTV